MAIKLTRRDFLKAGALTAASAILTGCQDPRRWVTLEPYVKPPEEQLTGVATWYASTCRMCPAGCGILVRVMNGRAVKIEGNPEHPLNAGKLCPRGQAGLQLLYNPDRLSGPVTQGTRGSRQFAALDWNAAINQLSLKLKDAGSDAAVWLGSTTSGHLRDLFSIYTQAAGAPTPLIYDLYSELGAFGLLQPPDPQTGGGLPSFDIGNADVVISFGADFLGGELSTTRYGVEFGKFRSRSLGKRGFLIQIEPKMTNTGAKADLWLPVKPGYEGMAAQAIARIVADQALGSAEQVGRAANLTARIDVAAAAKACDVPLEALVRVARLFATSEKPLALPGGSLGGMDGSAAALNAIQNLNLIAGVVGQPGGVIPTGESGKADLAPVRYSTYGDAQALIQKMNAGQVKLLLIHGVNPLYDLPEKSGLAAALSKVPTVVSFAPMVDETAAWADLILPDRTYLEGWGYQAVSPDFGVSSVSSQQPVVTPVFDARSTADVMLTASRATQASQKIPWADEVAYIRQQVSGQFGSGSDAAWTHYLQHGGWWSTVPRASTTAGQAAAATVDVPAPQYQGSDKDYPYNLYIYLSPLLGDGRGASLPWLQGVPDPMTTMMWQTWVEINPDTAAGLGITDGDELMVSSPFGRVTGYAYLFHGIRPDTISMPTGQGHTDSGRYARGRGSNPMALLSGQAAANGGGLAWNGVRVRVTKTGKQVRLATFEYKPGVDEALDSQDLPGR